MGQHVPFDPGELQFLNNFFTRFPIGNDPHTNARPMGLHRSAWEGKLHMTYRAWSRQASSEEYFRQDCDLVSDKRLDQTAAEFYAEVDKTVEELGMTMEVLSRVINALSYTSSAALFTQGKNDRAVADKLIACREEILAPIYEALRKKGYNKPELWG